MTNPISEVAGQARGWTCLDLGDASVSPGGEPFSPHTPGWNDWARSRDVFASNGATVCYLGIVGLNVLEASRSSSRASEEGGNRAIMGFCSTAFGCRSSKKYLCGNAMRPHQFATAL